MVKSAAMREYCTGSIRIGAVAVHVISLSDLLAAFHRIIERREKGYACFCEAHLCVRAAKDGRTRRVLEEATFVLPDGVAITWGARLLGERFPDRLDGPSVMLDVCRYGLNRGYRHFFYGGAEGIPERLAERLIDRYPGLKVAGTFSPPFRQLTPEEDAQIITMINERNPDIVWVGLGAPKQEIWMHRCLPLYAPAVALGIGASLDFIAGTVKRSPQWMSQSGLEWAYRLYREPRRLWRRYLINDPKFLLILARTMKRPLEERVLDSA